ncbi:MAG TPA: MBL fold metallo-hydrolase [Steroidobacteraceae bacterium]
MPVRIVARTGCKNVSGVSSDSVTGITLFLILAMLGIAGAVEGASAPLSPLNQAIAAIGGKKALMGITAETVVGSGVRFNPDQARYPGAPPLQREFAYTSRHDVAGDRLNIHWIRNTDFKATLEFSEVINKDLGYFDGKDNQFSGVLLSKDQLLAGERPKSAMFSSRVAAVRKHQRLFHPELLLRSALEKPEIVTVMNDATVSGQAHWVVSLQDAFQPIRLYINKRSGLVTQLQTEEEDPMWGDATITVEFGDWETVGGVKMPFQLTLSEAGHVLHKEARSSIIMNPKLDDNLFVIPPDVRFDESLVAVPPSLRTVPNHQDWQRGEAISEYLQREAYTGVSFDFNSGSVVKTERIARGIYQITGGAAHSMAIEMAKEIVVVEAPIDDDRSRAVIDKLKELIPGKPIKWVVNSHFHDDHSGGLRTYIAEGATVVTGAANVPYYQQVFSAPHALRPDALQEKPTAAKIQAVCDTPFVISDGERKVSVFPLASTHADGMVIVYVDDAKVLFAADIYNPGGWPGKRIPVPALAALAQELYRGITDLKLDVQTIVGAHGSGNTATFETLKFQAGF